jgi:hypothetical protein
MKMTVEIAAPLVHQARAKPFTLRDGSFSGGLGLQPGVDWQGLSALAYEDDCQS